MGTMVVAVMIPLPPVLSTVPRYEDLYVCGHEAEFTPLPAYKPDWDDAALIVHSSGQSSTDHFYPSVHSMIHRFDCISEAYYVDESSFLPAVPHPMVWRTGPHRPSVFPTCDAHVPRNGCIAALLDGTLSQ